MLPRGSHLSDDPRSDPPVTVLHIDTGDDWRGGQRQIFLLMEGLLRRGHRPLLATRPGAALARRAEAIGVPLVPIDPIFPEWGPWTVLRLRRAIRRHRIDLLHPHSSHAVALAALAAAGTPVRVVVTRHVVFPLRRNLGTRLKYARGDRFIAVCEAAARSLRMAGIAPERIDVVHGGLPPLPDTPPASRATLEELRVPAGAPLVVMVTSLFSYKDPLTFIRSIALARERIPELRALLVGEGPLRAEAERAINELDLGGVVHMTGYREDALALTAAARVACLTSREEGLSGAVMEAMLLGKPVVSTDSGGPSDMLQDGMQGFLVPVGDARGVADAVIRLLLDPPLAARLGEAARRRAASFTAERMIAGTLDVYHRMLGTGPR